MAYAISVPSESALAVEINADSASDAVTIARKLAAKGQVPTIEKDGQRYSLEQLEQVAAQLDSGEAGNA